MVFYIGSTEITTPVGVTRYNDTGSERTFQRHEQDREDITGRLNAKDPTRDHDNGSERTLKRQEQDRDNSTGQ